MTDRRKTTPARRQKPAAGHGSAASGSAESPQLSDDEVCVLEVFRTYLMTPGKMLCLNNADTETMRRGLTRLVDSGMLLPEEMKGGYSLTRSGFEAMKSLP